MSSRGGLPPPSRSSLPGVLRERLARCWPICGARTRPKPARTPTGPPGFELPQPSRTSRSGRGRLMPPNMQTHRPHCQKGGARQPETYSSEAVTANHLLVIPPEKSADVPVLRPHSDLQVHLFNLGLQPYATAAEGQDGPQQINLEVRPRLQLATQRSPVVLSGSIEHDSAFALVAHSLVDCVVWQTPRPPRGARCRC
ncbi:hypothetical protein T05_1353 [Trichinella murrelli]|uniref:Uncharacterized protein n=1 Tax=Trichinella murrelli TaxID=144512 RepID=A0A0V0T7E6_9BILA|nr:hypothetical protein T05_1353 [Trichinella murrelli]